MQNIGFRYCMIQHLKTKKIMHNYIVQQYNIFEMRCATNIKGKVISEMQLNIEISKCIFDIEIGMKAYQMKRVGGIKRNSFKGNENIIECKDL